MDSLNNQEFDVSLRPISIDDTDNIVKWRNSDSVRLNLYNQALITADQHINYLKNYVESGRCIQFIIVMHHQDISEDVGTVFLKDIDKQSNKAEFGIFIGEPSARGNGVAKKATVKLLNYAFGEKKFNKVYLTLFSDNIPAFRTYLSTGFRLEGVLRDEFFNNNRFIDVIRMGITRADWYKG